MGNSLLSLSPTLSVPPDKPVIRGRDGEEVLTGEVGPYEVEEDLVLECEVTGGQQEGGEGDRQTA